MAVTADSVVVELLAKTDGYTANINGAANDTNVAMSKIEKSASRAEAQVVRSAGQMAQGTRNFGRQIADIGAQASGGQSPFLIFAQQAPQLAEALTDMGGKAAGVASFLTGPFGASLLAAGSVLGVLLSKALETGEGMDDLVKKLGDQATKAATSAQADRIFASTQAGLAAQIRKTTDALNAENASLRTNAQLRNVQARSDANQAQSQLAAANDRVAAAQRRLGSQQVAGAGTSGSALAVQRSLEENRAAQKELADARTAQQQASINLNRSRVFQAAEEAAAEATAAGRITKSYDDRIRAVQRAAIADAQAGKVIGAATKQRITALEQEKQAALDAASAKTKEGRAGPRGPSEATLARRTEVQRVRGVRNDEAYQNDLESAVRDQIQAVRARTTDIVTLAQYARDEVASETRKRLQQIDADESANKYTTEQAEELRQITRGNAVLRTININRDERQKLEDQNTSIIRAAVNDQQSLLQAQLGATRSLADRRKIEQQLIDLKYQELIDEQKRARARALENGDIAGATVASRRIVSLGAEKGAEDATLNERYKGRYQQYRESLSSVDSLQDSIDAVKVDALEKVSDALTDATTKALGLKGAFGQVIGELIRIGIQRKLIGPLADSLFGAAGGGGSSGQVGSLIASAGKLFGRASGGYMAPGSVARVNEGRGGVELLRMGAQGGTVIPLGLSAAQRSSSTTIVSAPQFNLRGAVVTEQLYADMQRISEQSATRAGGAAYAASQRSAPGTLAQYDKLEG